MLAFDLGPSATNARFSGAQRLRASVRELPALDAGDGFSVAAQAVVLTAGWRPDASLSAGVEIRDLAIGELDPVTVRLPPGPLDRTRPDLGLGLPEEAVPELVGLLAVRALRWWGTDSAAYALAGLLGLHADLPGLPSDWPRLLPGTAAGLLSALEDPRAALATHLRTVASGHSRTGEPFLPAALRWLSALLTGTAPTGPGAAPGPGPAVTGRGSDADPWAVPLLGADVDLLLWLDPPPAPGPSLVEAATDGETLLRRLAAAVDPPALRGRDPGRAGEALDRLDAWLAAGDGLVPYASATAVPAGWTVGTAATCPHDALPTDPAVVAQVVAQLRAWGAGPACPVLLIGGDAAGWSALIGVLEPGRDPDADTDPSVPAVCRVVPAPDARTAIGPVLAAAGAARLVLAGHGPAGVLARTIAAENPTRVRGVVTLGAPHAGSSLLPLTDPEVADAARLARQLIPGDALSMLATRLDGGPFRNGRPAPPESFAGMPPTGAEPVPGLAIGSRVGSGLVRRLAAAHAQDPAAPAVAPSHLGVGVRVPAGTAPGRPGDLTVDGHVRVDALRVRVGTGPEPGRPAQRISVHAWAGRAGGWLIGGPGPGVAVRARLAELAVVAGRDATGGVALSTVAVAHEAGPAGITTDRADLADLADGELRDFLLRLGTAPGPLLAERMPDLLTLVLPALGARSTGDGGWELALPAGAVLAVTPGPWTVHARTTAAAGLPIEVDAALGLPGFAATVTAGVTVGGLRVRWSSASGTLSAALEPWLPEVVLLPAPPPAVLADAVLAALPGVLTSAAIALVVQPALGDGARALPLDRLISAPAAWLRRPAALGRTDGPGFDAAAVAELIDLVVTAIGGLPGGLTLTARAAAGDAVDLRLAGTVALDAATITIDLGLAAGPAGVRPSGLVGVGVTLPGDWGAVTVEAGLAAEGLVLAIVLDTGDRIDLLPRFGGLGAVAAAGARLLPRVLQELVDELRPPVGDPEGLLRAVLALATALDVYADDSEGFTAPERAERLAAMLDPGWWAARAADPAQVAEIVAGMAGMFGPPPLLPLPAGQLRAEDGTVVWTVQPPGIGTVTVRLGWTAAGPVLTVGAAGVRIGPVVLDEFAAGVAPGPHADLTLHLEVDGLFAPIRPAVRAEVDAGRFAVAVLPLGADAAGDLSLTLAPVPALAATPEAALLLVERWGLPIAAELLLRAADGAAPGGRPEPLLRRPLWQDGPTAEAVLVASGLVTTTAGGLRAARPLPEPGGAVLRALQAAATGIAIQVVPGQLEMALISEPAAGGSRTGLRLRGRADIEAGELTVRLRFGDASWLTDADRGVTVWLLEPDPTPGAALPLRLTAALRVAGFGMLLSRTDGEPLTDGVVVLGAAGGLLFLEAEFLGADRAPAVTVGGLGAALEVQQAFVNMAGEDADSFIAKVLPPQLAAPFDLAVIYRDGALRIEGGGGEPGRLELAVPLDLDLAVIRITELLLALQTGTGGVSIEAALSGGADVGPVHAVVKRVGLVAAFRPEGPQLRFRPPDMVGLSIDSPSLRLGGFLLVDEPRGRYIGAIEISLLGKFEISAVGLITTKNPDGTPGFSLLFIISIIFPTPIALGYGFFFAGAGGMLGLNRSVDLDRLRDGLRTGAADSILFPTDVVRRADAIVRDLEAVFPVAPGQFLVGPMALITWGVPALISIKLGIILELGARVKVAVLGAVRAALPDPGSAVLDLKAAFLGTVDVAAGLLTFDAAIYDSYLGAGDLKFTFEGDIAVRLSWGAQPDFVMSVGGFHPTYKPAAHLRLPTMRRISISLLRDNPRLTLATYFAITSNTVQFGARLSFYLGVSGFSVEGDFGFDVLFQFSPFRFDAHAWAHLAVKAGGSVLLCLTLDFTLRGPAPWIARGTASFSILFFSVSVEFEATFGDTVLDTMPGIALLPRLIEELGRPENWTGALAAGATSVVSLLAVPSTVIDAGGSLTVSQRVLPLGTDVTLFGTSKPTDLRRLDLLGLDVGDDPAGSEPVTDAFSPAAFQEMSDSDKLRAPAFERRPAGARVTSGARLHTTHTVVRPAKFDLIVVDADDTTVTVARPLDAATLGRQVRGAAAARSPAAKRRRLDAETASVLAAGEPADAYAVTPLGDLRPLTATGGPATPGSPEARLPRSEAEQLAAALDNAGFDVQVVPAAQVEVPVR
ncbi:hypothetical protein Asp14428_21240 [Actinoplanes sp. NBRC 14428]|nr:hypothetical protein Asp14428_21240 [Actinoplanes sp. NBRC 14428]